MIVPVAEFAPDQPLGAGFSDAIYNVLPRTARSYGPWRSLSVYSTALTARCQGAIAMQDTAGNVNVFAGDATKLYRLVGGSTFTDVSGAVYATPAAGLWWPTLVGQRAIMSNFIDAPQSFLVGTSALFADLITSGETSLRWKYAAMVKNFLMALNMSGTYAPSKNQRVHWSAIGDPTNFPTPGSTPAKEAQSSFLDLQGDHGEGTGIMGDCGPVDAVVFFERAIWRGRYAGPPQYFDFNQIENGDGCTAPNSIVKHGSKVYYLGEDGFAVTDGVGVEKIGLDKVDDFFAADVDLAQYHRVSAAVDVSRPIVYWAYPRSGVSNCNRLLAYHTALKRWSATEIDATVCELLMRSLSVGVVVDTLGGLVDSYNQPLDDRSFTGGRLTLAAFDTSHRLSYFSGANLAPRVETQDANIIDGHRALVTATRPIVDGGAPTVAIGGRDDPALAPTFGPDNSRTSSGVVPGRKGARWHRARIKLPAASNFTQISGVEVPKENIVDLGPR